MKLTHWTKFIFYFLFIVSGIFFIGLYSCSTDDKNQTVIKGNIHFPESNKLYFYSYANTVDKYLAKKSVSDSAIIDEKGNYSILLQWNNPDIFDLKIGNSTYASNFFLYPGDKLTIDFKEDNKMPSIKQNCESAKCCRFIVSYIDTFYENPLTKHLYYIQTNYLTPDEFIFYCNDRNKKQTAFYDKYFEDEESKKAFNDLMISEINYQSAVDRLMYAWKKRMKGESNLIEPSYYSFLNPALIENKNALSSPAYIRFLNLYINDMYEKMLEKGELSRHPQEKITASVEKYKIAVKHLNKPYRDVVLYNIIHDDIISSGEEKLLNGFSNIPIDSLIMWFNRKYPAAQY